MNSINARRYARAIPVPICVAGVFLFIRPSEWEAHTVIFGLFISTLVALGILRYWDKVNTLVFALSVTLISAFLTANFMLIFGLYRAGDTITDSFLKGAFIAIGTSPVAIAVSVPGFLLLICSDLVIKKLQR